MCEEGATESLRRPFGEMGVGTILRERTSPKISSSRLKRAMIDARAATSSRCRPLYWNNCSADAPSGRTSTDCLIHLSLLEIIELTRVTQVNPEVNSLVSRRCWLLRAAFLL
jgi:hypothetical protein